MLKTAILILLIYIFAFKAEAQNDTIYSKLPSHLLDQVEYADVQPDTSIDILAVDSIHKLVIFRFGNEIILRSKLKDTLIFPILNSERFGEGDVFSDINNALLISANISWLYPKNLDPLLQINWFYKMNGMHVWTETDGIQIWNINAQRCYLDCITHEYVYSSGFNGSDGQTEVCDLDISIQNSVLKVQPDQCLKYPIAGTYLFTKWGYIKKR